MIGQPVNEMRSTYDVTESLPNQDAKSLEAKLQNKVTVVLL